MKRELKRSTLCQAGSGETSYCRAYPDEKGIETISGPAPYREPNISNCRAYPDEKGIETEVRRLSQILDISILQSLSR